MNIHDQSRSARNRPRQQLEASGATAMPDSAAAGNAEAPSLAQSYPRLARYRLYIVAGVMLVLLWTIITRGFAAYLAGINPETALWLNPDQATALTRLADEKLNPRPPVEVSPSSQQTVSEPSQREPGEPPQASPFPVLGAITGDDLERVELWAERALRNDPLNARALRLLGQVAQRNGDGKRADALMRAATNRSLHESLPIYWTMVKRYRDGNYESALRYADILLRTRYQVYPYVMPLVAAMAEKPAASDQVKSLLAKNPPWRSPFLAHLPHAISDARTPLEFLLSLKNASTPPRIADLRVYLDFLLQRGFPELAYYAWLQFLPPEQLATVGRLHNGGFDFVPSGLPFDWRFEAGSGATIEVAERPEQNGNKALLMEFGPGRVEFGGVSQVALLPPGDYQLEGRYKSDLVSQRGMQWRILCGQKSIGESRPVSGTEPTWIEFAVSFSVPDDCLAQTIKLVLDARYTSETFVSGSIWYDDLKIASSPKTEEGPQSASDDGEVSAAPIP